MSDTMPAAKTDKPRRRNRNVSLDDGGTPSLKGIIIKILALGVIDAISLFIVMALIGQGEWGMVALVIAVTLVLNYLYLRRGGLPGKYLAPGLVFMAIFQIYVVVFSGYIAFTNYGSLHNSNKDDALNALQLGGQQRVPDSATYNLKVLEGSDGKLNFLLTLPGVDGAPNQYFVGNQDSPLQLISNAELDDSGVAVGLEGYRTLKLVDLSGRQAELVRIKVPVSDNPADGIIMTPDASLAYLYMPTLVYDKEQDTITRASDGKVFSDVGTGAFTASDGEELAPGWRVEVGFKNFERAFSEERIRGPLVKVAIWTFVFAGLTVLLTFVVGLGLALLFNDNRLRGKKFYRAAMILPYAFPAFLSAFVWKALFNEKYGFINNVILGGAQVPWLSDPTMAKVAVLMVNLWLGFPYMFLITTGALQAIPEELTESAKIDGATAWQQFRLIKLPLLLVSIAPLLITSFAFNFNNFTLIYLVTGGGPKDIEADINVGETDILITLVYKIAFSTGEGRDYGLASAFSILIFLVVGTISYLGFRRTKTLEDVN